MITNEFLNIDEVRNELVGKIFKIIDIESQGNAIYLEDESGRMFVIDYLADKANGAQVIANKTDSEQLEELQMKFDTLLEMVNVDIDEFEEKVIKKYYE